MKHLRQSVFLCKDKNQLRNQKKQPFIFCTFDESPISNIGTLWYMTVEFIELNWICKHVKQPRFYFNKFFVLNWAKQSSSLWVSLSTKIKKLKWKVWTKFNLVKMQKSSISATFLYQKVRSHRKKYCHIIASSVLSLLATSKAQCDWCLFFDKFDHNLLKLLKNSNHSPGCDLKVH